MNLIKKILINFSKPQKIPYKICNKLKNFYFFLRYTINYNEEHFLNIQENNFIKFDLNRKEGLEKLDVIKKKYSFIENPMSSEHQVIFSSLSNNKNFQFKKILEIGTFDGKNSFLLSKLFEESEITTIDLKDDDENFKNSYNRNTNEKRNKFIADRNKIIKMSKNIKFIQKNSIKLIFNEEKFDLIWIDGAHGYPFVTIDIINSLRKINKNGIILCDDIYISKMKEQDQMYESNASYETLEILKKNGVIDYYLFYKRLDKKNNSIPFKRQFVGLVKLI